MPDVALNVGGSAWGGWTQIRIQRGIEQVAGRFTLGLTERWPGQESAREIRPGDSCTVGIDGETVVSGFVDDIEASFGASERGITVSGRDRTGDLVDCSAENKPGEWAGRRLDRIAADLCRPFGVKVSVAVDAGKAFGKFTIQKGETAWEALERAARQRGLLLVADGRGGLVITRASVGRLVATLSEGENLLSARGTYSMRDRFSRYTALGQTAGSDWTSPEDNAEPSGRATDPAVGRHRPLTILAEEQGDSGSFQQRADWEARVRAGRARRIEADVQGWRHSGGLWAPNAGVRFRSASLRIDQALLIAGVEFLLDGGRGSITTLSLVKPETFDMLPLPEKEETGW